MKHLIIAAAGVLAAGCYTYSPAPETAPDVGNESRIELSSAVDLPYGQLVIRDVVRLDGTIYNANQDTVAVAAEWIRNQLGERYHADGVVYYLETDNVKLVSNRSIEPAKSIVAAAAIVGAGIGMLNFVAEGSAGNSQTGKGGENIGARVEVPIGN